MTEAEKQPRSQAFEPLMPEIEVDSHLFVCYDTSINKPTIKDSPMRATDLTRHKWIPWQEGADNTQANTDIPLEESVDLENPTTAVVRIIEADSTDQGWTQLNSWEELMAHCKAVAK